MELILMLVLFAVGAGCGAAAYRALLKKDPETLERWAKEAKALGDRFN